MPTMAYWRPPDSRSRAASVRMPHTFFPRQKTSLTHLIWASTPAQALMANATAAAAQVVRSRASWAESWGRRRTLRYSPVSGGEKKLCPRRPRPAVCSTAASTRPSASPSSARWRRRVLVEVTCCRTSSRRPGTVTYRAMLWAERRALSASRQ